MKILFLAYACEPERGSELGVGWKWPLYLSADKNKDIYVITRANNRKKIEDYWRKNICPDNLHFFYYDLPNVMLWAKKHGLSVNIYYALWLQGSCSYAQKLHEKYHFDMAHHITFGVFRDASALYKLQIPYVVGPVGGGETTPKGLLALFSLKEQLKETIRSMANAFAFINPLFYLNFNRASLILTKTEDTKRVLKRWKDKTLVRLEIGINEVLEDKDSSVRKENSFLYVGRFTYWKGYQLTLMAFQKYAKKHPSSTLKMIGRGDIDAIKAFAEKHNLQNQIEVIPWIKQSELKNYYSSSSAMVFPSMHDSSGNVVLEALSYGLPVICLDCGGPASVLGKELGDLTIQTKDKSIEEVINGLVSKMEVLNGNDAYAISVREKCLYRAKQKLWKEMIPKAYNEITDRLFNCKENETL